MGYQDASQWRVLHLVLLQVFLCVVSPGLARAKVERPEVAGCSERAAEVSLSPNGVEVAELMSPRPTGCMPERITLVPITHAGAPARTLVRSNGITQVSWVNDSTIAYVSGSLGDVLDTVDLRTNRGRMAVRAPGPIMQYVVDPAGRRVEYMYRVWGGRNDYVSRRVTEQLSTKALILPHWASFYGREYVVRTARLDGRPASGREGATAEYVSRLWIRQLAWLGERPVVLGQTAPSSPWKASVMDLARHKTMVSGREFPFIRQIAGNHSGSIAVASFGGAADTDMFPSFEPLHLWAIGPSGRLKEIAHFSPVDLSRLWWAPGNLLWAQIAPGEPFDDQRLVAIDPSSGRVIRTIRWPHGSLEDCQMNEDRTIALCAAETLTQSKRFVRVDLRSQRIATVSLPGVRTRSLGLSFRELTVRNGFGQVSSGFLAVPEGVQANSGKMESVPLVVMLYGFNRVFAAHGQWVGAYPVRKLVKSGIAVLLLNFPYAPSWRRGDTAMARQIMLEEPLSTLESAPQAVEKAGFKVGRVMVMGWSHGGLIAAQAIQRSCKFVAAEVGDPAAWNITAYSLENEEYRDFLTWLFGGPPVGRWLKNYLAFDPVPTGSPPNGPILFEYVARHPEAGQYLQEWRGVGASVQAFAYHRSVHYLNVRAEARLSRARNLAWAKLNLLGPQSVPERTLKSLQLSVPPSRSYRCH
jgi:hypothetical protein